MGDIKLFSINGNITELLPSKVGLEKELQTLIENNMETFFGVTFIKSEFAISNGRIDSLGIDENFCPVIFEYKRSINENVINQGLFYLDWLLDHKAEFKLLVMEVLGYETADKIDWSMPCVICIASDFTKFDEHAVNQMHRNIKLVKYKKYSELILFEHINAPNVKPVAEDNELNQQTKTHDKTFLQQYENAPANIKDIYNSLRSYILSLGDDVSENQLKLYVAFRKIRNFACIEVYSNRILMNLKLNPDIVDLKENYIRDIREIGHWGTGDLQVIIKSSEDCENAKSLIERAYIEG